MTAVHEYCTGLFWNVPPTEDSILWKVMKKCDPPAEVHRTISVSEFFHEYDCCRAWLKELEDAPYGHACFLVRVLIVKQLETQNFFEVKILDSHAASPWRPRWVPAFGQIISVIQRAACSVLSIRKVPDMIRFYAVCMPTPLQEI